MDAASAEDILQSSYIKALQHGSELREDESAVAWFYRILRNALVDHYRKRSSRAKAHEDLASETPESYELEIRATACVCIGDIVKDLKAGQREVIEEVELKEVAVKDFAQSHGITVNNATVSLHRARKAVAKKLTAVCGACAEHKCLDCTCRRSQL